nr:hypothetical protein [Tanacetum cinerariifolium]
MRHVSTVNRPKEWSSNFCGFKLGFQGGGERVISYLHFGCDQCVMYDDLLTWTTQASCPTSLKASGVEKLGLDCWKRKFRTRDESDISIAKVIRPKSDSQMGLSAHVPESFKRTRRRTTTCRSGSVGHVVVISSKSSIANTNVNQHGNGNGTAARAKVNGNANNGNQIRCYNYRGMGLLARNCTVRPRTRDVAYLQTQLQVAQTEEARIQLQAEEFYLMADVWDLDEIEKVNANYILMANLQQALTSGTQTNKAPVYDLDG